MLKKQSAGSPSAMKLLPAGASITCASAASLPMSASGIALQTLTDRASQEAQGSTSAWGSSTSRCAKLLAILPVKFAFAGRCIDLGQRFATARGRRVARMGGFVIDALGRDHIRAVYPLIRQAVPSLELAAWLRFARQLTGGRRSGQCGIV